MFLNILNSVEKDCFMRLAVAMIKADGCVEEMEEQIISAYAEEIQRPLFDFDEEYDVNVSIEELAANSTLQTKRIIFLELLGLAFADGNYAVEEKALLQQLIDAFQFDSTFIERAINAEDAYISAYMSIVNLIEKGE